MTKQGRKEIHQAAAHSNIPKPPVGEDAAFESASSF
jgi:hypothetical protein